MTGNETADRDWLPSVRRYRRLFWGCLFLGVLGFLGGDLLGYELVGLGVYWAGAAGMFLVWKGTDLQVFDERERELDRRASHVTLTIIAVALIVGGPGQIAFAEVGFEFSRLMEGALWGYTAQFVVFGVVYLGIRLRS
jgi:uncharacterized membrane protein